METSFVQSIKLVIVDMTGLSKDALHVHVGLAVFVILCLLWRKPPHALAPVLVTVLVACLGEAVDRRDDIVSMGYWLWGESLKDAINTVLWPCVLFALARWGRASSVRAWRSAEPR
jgi:hypothetical protein